MSKRNGLVLGMSMLVAIIVAVLLWTRPIPRDAQVIAKFLEDHNGAITSLATIVIAWFTFTLWRATAGLWKTGNRQAQLTKDAMVAGERAFVFATSIRNFWERIPNTNNVGWRFRPQWENSGDTPTKNMRMHTECVVREVPLPPDFDFNYATNAIGTALIPPKNSIWGGLGPSVNRGPITPEEMTDVQAGKKYLYIWGWARYFDVFPDTPQHITRFCWQILPNGDPNKVNEFKIDTIHYASGNCADDECP